MSQKPNYLLYNDRSSHSPADVHKGFSSVSFLFINIHSLSHSEVMFSLIFAAIALSSAQNVVHTFPVLLRGLKFSFPIQNIAKKPLVFPNKNLLRGQPFRWPFLLRNDTIRYDGVNARIILH